MHTLLALEQCTEIPERKLKSRKKWSYISSNQKIFKLHDKIKPITFIFKEQKCLQLSIHQNNMSNTDYFELFCNHVDIASLYNSNLHDNTVKDWVEQSKRDIIFKYIKYNKNMKQRSSKNRHTLVLSQMFLMQIDKKRSGKILEDLDNYHTKGKNNYLKNMVNAYQFLNK